MNDDDLVTICSKCLKASCWWGEFYCDDYKTAGTVDLTVGELKMLNLEHPDYWKRGITKCDLWRTYRVKKPNYQALGWPHDVIKLTDAIVPRPATEHCAIQFIRAVLMESAEAILTTEFMSAEFTKEVRKYLK